MSPNEWLRANHSLLGLPVEWGQGSTPDLSGLTLDELLEVQQLLSSRLEEQS